MYLWVDNKDGAPQPKAQYRSPLPRLDIPVGRWWHLEAYMERTASYDGHLTIWQDGVKLYEFSGVRSTYPGGLVEWTVNNYADDLSPAPTTLYIDDAAISTGRTGPSAGSAEQGPPGQGVSGNSAAPASVPPPPPEAHYFAETQFQVDHEPFWAYFTARGGVDTFGFPISRTFVFLGCTTQFFQRHLLQQCSDGPVRTMNLLDPELMPYDRINGSTFPVHDPHVASEAPGPDTPNYGQAVLAHLRRVVPDTFDRRPVRFFDTFVKAARDRASDPDTAAMLDLEIWGFPTSQPALDPTNHNFSYQRFQRGIMHYDRTTGTTTGILVADWFKSIITAQGLPPDLAQQAADSRFVRQYCPGNPRWLCRPGELPGTDLTFAFQPQ
jgi:hypothetical protein